MQGVKVESADKQVSETDVVIDPDLEDQTLSEMNSHSEHPELFQARSSSGGDPLACSCPPCIRSFVFVVIMLSVLAIVRSLRA